MHGKHLVMLILRFKVNLIALYAKGQGFIAIEKLRGLLFTFIK